jgi:catechol 2,3-dioxygenase-like lactoylglutathione lyase family enzyme
MEATPPVRGASEETMDTISATQTKFDVGGLLLDRPFKIQRLGHFGFDMHDTDAGVAFYAGLLGLRITDTLDFRDIAPNPKALEGLAQTKAYFLNYAGDHHSFVVFPKRAIDAVGRKPARNDMFINQMSWQVGSLKEVRDALDWFKSIGNPIHRVGRDMPGSNWHSYPIDAEGHINETYYGMEQIGWNLRSKPKAMYERGFRVRPELPQISEYQEIFDSEAKGVDLDSGFRIVEKRPFKYEVGGVMMARPFKITKLGPVRLWVKDVAREVEFYTRLFGLRLTEEVTWGGERCVFLRCNTEHHSLALYPETLRGKLGLSPVTSCFSVGFRIANYRQLKDALAFLKAEGAEIRHLPPALFPGMDHTAFVIDPQGHAVQLYAYMEQIGWDGKPRPAHLRRKVTEGADWPETLAPVSDDNDGEVYQGPLS